MMYRMNDGVAYLYKVLDGKSQDGKSQGGKPLRPLEGVNKANFEYIGISAEDYRFAMQANVKIEMRIRILQNKKISTQDVVRINDLYYRIWRIRHSVNKSNVPITDITLNSSLDKFEVSL